MKLLALDTATESMALALSCGERSWGVNAPGGAAASEQLIPSLMALLAEAELSFRDLDAIAFGQGPGAFTGVRTAVSVAQGLSFGLGLPTLAVDSLQILAEDASHQAAAAGSSPGEVFWALADARMGEIYAAAYAWTPRQPLHTGPPIGTSSEGRWQVLRAPALLSLAALNQALLELPPQHVTGSALRAFGPALHIPSSAQCWPDSADRAAALLRLSRDAWLQGLGRAPELALPVYLRDKVALTTLERQALAAPPSPSAPLAPVA
jgi:tRNA threonylcarbamoyladenosine biosynthesis protein TsaB